MSDNRTIYLAGAIHGLSDEECNAWRSMVKAAWPGKTLDPMRRDARGLEHDRDTIQRVVEDDKLDIAVADGVIVYFTGPSVGTSMEILWAWMLRKPIALIYASAGEPSLWLSYHCKMFTDMDSALLFLNSAITERK